MKFSIVPNSVLPMRQYCNLWASLSIDCRCHHCRVAFCVTLCAESIHSDGHCNEASQTDKKLAKQKSSKLVEKKITNVHFLLNLRAWIVGLAVLLQQYRGEEQPHLQQLLLWKSTWGDILCRPMKLKNWVVHIVQFPLGKRQALYWQLARHSAETDQSCRYVIQARSRQDISSSRCLLNTSTISGSFTWQGSQRLPWP